MVTLHASSSSLIRISTLFFCLSTASASAGPAGSIPLIDGRVKVKIASNSAVQTQALLQAFGVPTLQTKFNGKNLWDCSQPSIEGQATGSFTRSQVKQQVYFYTACYRYAGGGSTDWLQGAAIMENGKIVNNIFPLNEGVQGYGFTALSDLTKDGMNELVATNGYGHMGEAAETYSIFTLASGKVQMIKKLEGNSGNCSSGRDDASDEALVYWVKLGQRPQFWTEAYTRGCADGMGAGAFRLFQKLRVIP